MRKTMLGALIASAFAFGPAHAGLLLDLTGGGGGGLVINADALDWAPSSFLALNGNAAISSFASGNCANVSCSFDVLTHSKLIGYDVAGPLQGFTGLPAFAGEITMVARYTETVTGFVPGANASAQFRSTGAGWVEFYAGAANATDLTGSGFNDGKLIGRLTGVSANVLGSFTVDGLAGVTPLDGFGADDYAKVGGPTQLTVTGSGAQGTLKAGLSSPAALDPTFFLNGLTGFSLNFTNISIGVPYASVNPSDCFNPNQDIGTNAAIQSGAGVVATVAGCNTNHMQDTYFGQTGFTPTGYLPRVGPVNGLDLGSPDFVAQTDYNSAVAVPEPGSLALVGLALGVLGFAARRRA